MNAFTTAVVEADIETQGLLSPRRPGATAVPGVPECTANVHCSEWPEQMPFLTFSQIQSIHIPGTNIAKFGAPEARTI